MLVHSFPRRHAMALAITLALASAGADAATITVTSTLDGPVTADTTCTLREALASLSAAANTGGCLATGAYGTADAVNVTATGTITLDPTQNALAADVPSTITGPGAAQLTISGGNATTVLYAYGPGISLSGVTIANGNSGSPGAGGVDVFYGSLTLANCTLSGNVGGYGSAALAIYGQLNINNCTITGNTGQIGGAVALLSSGGNVTSSTISTNTGGAPPPTQRAGHAIWRRADRGHVRVPNLPAGAPGLGAGISVFGDFGGKGPDAPAGGPQVSITRSTISGNTAQLIGGGVLLYASSAQVTDSTISGNTAAQAGGGAYVVQSPIVIANSTISGNTATGQGGGGGLLIGAQAATTAAIQSTTVNGNVASTAAAGVLIAGPVTATLASSIFANSTGAAPADVGTVGQGFAITATTSLVENPGNSGITATGGNLVGVDPQLGPLANNGGPTQTHLPATASPVVNAGANPSGAAFDQRGTPFARVVGAAADIGSVEVPAGGPPPTPSFVANVPTTSTWGGMLLAGALAALAWLRRPRTARRRR
ncbi:MAG TPA: choice-of-anchor Q domain-containing protein [Xanthomonadales bacterium]|nr:choice-of-anchor Q domain-containing protein [Xanthomonadales bacterium]